MAKEDNEEKRTKYLGTSVAESFYDKCKVHAAVTKRQMNELIEDAMNILIEYEGEGGKRYVPGCLSVQDSSGGNETE